MDVFCDLLGRVGDHSSFGVNYDPSNTILAGEDPLELLRRVKQCSAPFTLGALPP